MSARRTMMTECWSCQHKRKQAGTHHIQCIRPDPAMTGNLHGIEHGWFFYPLVFDPVWKTRDCANYEAAS